MHNVNKPVGDVTEFGDVTVFFFASGIYIWPEYTEETTRIIVAFTKEATTREATTENGFKIK